MPLKDECSMCGRVLPYSYLRRCQRCGRIFCRDCMIPEVSTGDFTRMFCINCARKTVSPTPATKYSTLSRYLKFRSAFTNVVKLSFAEIDGIIGDNLPMSAYKTEQWWSNNPNNMHAKAWTDAGWEMNEVNLKEGFVIFKKVRIVKTQGSKPKARSGKKKPFTPVCVQIHKSNKPSKTKVSKLYARIKNLERQRASVPTYSGSFKPKSKHEKRLFKSHRKPQ